MSEDSTKQFTTSAELFPTDTSESLLTPQLHEIPLEEFSDRTETPRNAARVTRGRLRQGTLQTWLVQRESIDRDVLQNTDTDGDQRKRKGKSQDSKTLKGPRKKKKS